ncbi:uncharacterized protein LOC127366611 isoform X2 [Dicentrarchus labrax]|uniref:uncharacterized protein LOC127366611 isoform X2 n=1 Tax=Dicentrarchus labrax TaxID=13489 RepID=UPI0021F64B03|nr:uncharacterized protein LOC127366611 isoform X2 [Dicentrarchus labrax]
MMMPVYPGAPWLPKFKGPNCDLKYHDWKEQIQGLLGAQELAEARKIDIVLGALAGEAKRQVSVLEDDERDRARKIFLYLDSLYGDRTPAPVLRSQFFSCVQRPDETVPSFILRLRELYCRLRQHDPDGTPPDTVLRDQLLLGLRESSLAQALKVYARRNPDETFSAIRQEALLLDTEHGNPQPEVICASVYKPNVPPPSQDTSWRETLKREIMEDVKSQMTGLTQELLREIKPLLQPAVIAPQPLIQPYRERQRSVSQTNTWDEQDRYQKLGKLSRVDEADVHGACDLNLSLEGDCVVGVTLVNAAVGEEDQKLPIGVSELSNRPDLSEQQQEELRALLLKWQKVFAQHNEDFGRTDLVQHRIHTGDAPPIRERHRPLPPAMYKEMKSLLSGLKKP